MAPAAMPSRGSQVLREPFPDGPSEAGEVLALLDEIGSPATMGDGRAALLRLRHRRRAARRAGRELARDRMGSERGLSIADARGRRCWRRSRWSWMLRRSSGCPTERAGAFVTGATMANFTRARRRAARRARAGRLGRRGRRPVRRAADHGRRRRGGAPDAVQGARAGGLRARSRGARARRRSGPHARRCAAAALAGRRSSACRPATSTRARSIRSRAICRARARGRAPGCTSTAPSGCGPRPRRRRAHLAEGLGRRRLLGDRRAQVAERPVRQRPRIRPRRRRAARRDGGDAPITCPPSRACATRPTTRRSSRAVRAASTSGRRCARSAARDSPSSSSATAGRPRRFAEGLAAAGYEILNDVVLNQVLVSFGDARDDAARDRRRAGRRHVLVRRHGLAGPDGDAHQRVARGRRPTRTSSAASRRSCASLRLRSRHLRTAPRVRRRRGARARRCPGARRPAGRVAGRRGRRRPAARAPASPAR